MAVQCPGCQRAVAPDAEQRMPPWCPFCGGSLKGAAPAAAPPPAATWQRAAPSEPPTTAPSAASAAEGPATAPSDLGPVEAVFRSSDWRQAICWLVSLCCFAFAGLLAYIILNQVGKNTNAAYPLMGLAVIGGFAGLYLALSMAELSYQVCRDGFIEKRGGETRALRWDQVREIYQILHPAWKSFRIVGRRGFDIELTSNTKNHLVLGNTIEEKVLEPRLPEALAELNRGETLRFGPLGVHSAALYFGDDRAAWHQVTMSLGLNPEPVLGMQSNMLHLHIYSPAQTKAVKIEVGKIPNFRLFVEVVRHNWPQCLPPGL